MTPLWRITDVWWRSDLQPGYKSSDDNAPQRDRLPTNHSGYSSHVYFWKLLLNLRHACCDFNKIWSFEKKSNSLNFHSFVQSVSRINIWKTVLHRVLIIGLSLMDTRPNFTARSLTPLRKRKWNPIILMQIGHKHVKIGKKIQ